MSFFDDRSCIVTGCGELNTGRGFICSDCYLDRYGTIHARWNDLNYVRATQAEQAVKDKLYARQEASRKRTEERRAA